MFKISNETMDNDLDLVDPNVSYLPLDNESSTVNSTDFLGPPVIVIPLTIIRAIFSILGIILKLMIIFYEHFGRDTQKRPLLNRVSVNFLNKLFRSKCDFILVHRNFV